MPDPKKNKALYGNSILIFSVRFFANLATLLVMHYFAHYLAKDANGIYQNFWTRLSLTAGVAVAGISIFIFTYPPDTLRYLVARIRAKHYWLYGLFLLGAAATFAGLQQGNSITAFLIAVLFFILYLLNILQESLLMVLRRFRILVPVSIIYAVLFVVIHYVEARRGLELNRLLLWLIPLLFLKLLCFLPATLSFFRRKVALVSPAIDIRRVRSLWIHLGLFNIYSILFQWIDKYILSFVLAPSLSAIYFYGSVGIPFLPLVFGAVSSALLMQMNTLPESAGKEQKMQLLHYSSRLLSSVAFPVFCYLFVFAAELITVMFSEEYLAAVPVFLCAILVIPVRSCVFVAVLQNHQKGRIINFGAAMDLVLACLLMFPLYHWLSLPGVALSFVLSTYGQCFFYLYYSGKAMKVSMWSFIPWLVWAKKFLFFGALAFTLHGLLSGEAPMVRLLSGGIVIAVVALINLRQEYKRQSAGRLNSSQGQAEI